MSRLVVERDTVLGWRSAARAAWLAGWREPPEGWSASPIHVDRLVDAFPALHVRLGLTLRAWQHRRGRDGRAVPFAVPAGTMLDSPPADETAGVPRPPPAALPEPLDAVEGDGTLWSYIEASVLARELNEVGAFGHGSSWGLHHVLGDDAWDGPGWPHDGPRQRRPASEAGAWRFLEPAAGDLRPTVWQDRGGVTVCLHTYVALGRERIVRHRDHYENGGGLRAVRDEVVLAEGPRGYSM